MVGTEVKKGFYKFHIHYCCISQVEISWIVQCFGMIRPLSLISYVTLLLGTYAVHGLQYLNQHPSHAVSDALFACGWTEEFSPAILLIGQQTKC